MKADVVVTTYEARPQRVVTGPGAARRVPEEVGRLGGGKVMLIAGRTGLAAAGRMLDGLDVVATFTDVRPHVPVEVAQAAREMARSSRAELLLSVGGGSATGTAKAVAMTERLPIVAVPTTYAGSEATDVWGLTERGRKTHGTDPAVLPRTVVYDPELTLTLPVRLTVSSGLNALAHCIDSLWAPDAGPASTAFAVEGIRLLAQGLSAVQADGVELEARSRCQDGTYLAASAYAAAGSGLHHKICHVLGGAYDLEHAATHAAVLPHVVAFNAPAALEAADQLASALAGAGFGPDGGTNGFADVASPELATAANALATLQALYSSLEAPTSLGTPGLRPEQVPEAARLVLDQVPPSNPRPVTEEDLRTIIGRAQAGRRAAVVPL